MQNLKYHTTSCQWRQILIVSRSKQMILYSSFLKIRGFWWGWSSFLPFFWLETIAYLMYQRCARKKSRDELKWLRTRKVIYGPTIKRFRKLYTVRSLLMKYSLWLHLSINFWILTLPMKSNLVLCLCPEFGLPETSPLLWQLEETQNHCWQVKFCCCFLLYLNLVYLAESEPLNGKKAPKRESNSGSSSSSQSGKRLSKKAKKALEDSKKGAMTTGRGKPKKKNK